MPAPSFLAGLPKPVLFGLYGAVGGLLGALVFAEPLWQILEPKTSKAADPQVAVDASKDVEIPVNGKNTFQVKVAGAGVDDEVTVKFDNVPPGVKIDPVTITLSRGAGEKEVTATATSTAALGSGKIKVIAEATGGGKKVTAETVMNAAVVDPNRPQADVFFVLDVTASMQREIDGVKSGIRSFAQSMRDNKIDFRIGLLAFRDLTFDPEPLAMVLLKFKGEPFTNDVEEFRTQLNRRDVQAGGGGDLPESSLEALDLASNQPFRKGAAKVLLLITDADPKVLDQNRQHRPDLMAGAVKKTADLIRSRGIDAVHLVTNDEQEPIYRPLLGGGEQKTGGRYFNLLRIAAGGGFDELLDTFGKSVVEVAKTKNPEGKLAVSGGADKPTVKAVQSTAGYEEGTGGQLIVAIGLWTGAISGLVCLALFAGQHHYLRGEWPPGQKLGIGFAGGLVVGIVGGACGQALYSLAPADSAFLGRVFQLFGWALLGGLAGIGLSLFIPNLKWVHGLAGGALGGAVGGVGYLIIGSIAGGFVGRLVGGLLVGFCIGLMVAIVEAAFRRAWLEVRFGERETITVNLGPEPVKIGGDSRMCTVWARGAAPLAFRYFIRNGQVICDDAVAKAEAVVGNGDTRAVGNVTLTVHTGAGVAPAGAPPARPSPPPRPAAPVPAAAAPVAPPKPPMMDPSPLDFDPVPPPAPAAPPARPAPAAPPARPPVPAAGAKPPTPPAAPPRPAAPPPPAAKPAAGPRDPNACPSCGRANPGRPGARYCMMCDQTY